ncbi:hypothetical protein BU14_0169s0013 [Porphyra umbilicalis]|uniref:Uncharacterized protein n=1 Tax=Porphyra umbilicalis TaxID=2786 RepID=A0A1X6P7P7_PORUM|nr:hypothetical protein BU14_0169s0013 [Porphyra umbilicalis]|eukprot:OSX76912.1 hypothetical protein BU14_0169s0013 [Porphyra umbilicalis]
MLSPPAADTPLEAMADRMASGPAMPALAAATADRGALRAARTVAADATATGNAVAELLHSVAADTPLEASVNMLTGHGAIAPSGKASLELPATPVGTRLTAPPVATSLEASANVVVLNAALSPTGKSTTEPPPRIEALLHSPAADTPLEAVAARLAAQDQPVSVAATPRAVPDAVPAGDGGAVSRGAQARSPLASARALAGDAARGGGYCACAARRPVADRPHVCRSARVGGVAPPPADRRVAGRGGSGGASRAGGHVARRLGPHRAARAHACARQPGDASGAARGGAASVGAVRERGRGRSSTRRRRARARIARARPAGGCRRKARCCGRKVGPEWASERVPT